MKNGKGAGILERMSDLSFTHPEFLWLTPVAIPVGWWFVRRRRPALRFADLRLTDGLPRSRGRRARWGSGILRGIATLLFLVAAAGPRTPDLRTPIAVEGISIVFALDVSGSMFGKDFGPPGSNPISRIDAAKEAFRLFVVGGETTDGTQLQGRPTDQIGLVTFAATPETACPRTLEHAALLKILEDQQPKSSLDAGTNIGDAIAEGVIRLEAAGARRRKVLILLSDGEHNVDRGGPDGTLKPLQAAQLAANLEIPVYTIDTGANPADVPLMQRDDREKGRQVLESVSKMTSGRFFAANDPAELQTVCREIDRLERIEQPGPRYRRYHDYTSWVASAGLILLGILGLLERTAWRRIP